jgi:hypothetical protein
MRKSTFASVTLVGAVALTMFAAVPANAAVIPDITDGANSVTVIVIPGAFSITSAAAGMAGDGLGVPTTADGVDVSGMKSVVNVLDARAGSAGWVASVKASAFSLVGAELGAEPDESMAGAVVTYTPANLIPVGNSDATAVGVLTLTDELQDIVTAPNTSGFNTAVWDGDLSVAIPSSALAGVYTATITHSIL